MKGLENPIWWSVKNYDENLELVLLGIGGIMVAGLIVWMFWRLGKIIMEGAKEDKEGDKEGKEVEKISTAELLAFISLIVCICSIPVVMLLFSVRGLNTEGLEKQIEHKKEEWSVQKEEVLSNVELEKEDGSIFYTVSYGTGDEDGIEATHTFKVKDENIVVGEDDEYVKIYRTYTDELKDWVEKENKDRKSQIEIDESFDVKLEVPKK